MWTSIPPSNPNPDPFSSPSTFAAILDSEAPNSNSGLQKTMEDVWKDISLSSFQCHHPCSGGMVLLDFFSADPPPAVTAAVSPPPPPPMRPDMLILSSGRDQTRNPLSDQSVIPRGTTLLDMQFEDLVPADHHNAAGVGKNMFPETERNSGDRRHKRMIKNRESAARSRARKQAYTNELELEVAHLLEENARLKRQQQQWYQAAECHQHSKKKSLYRTSTAPF